MSYQSAIFYGIDPDNERIIESWLPTQETNYLEERTGTSWTQYDIDHLLDQSYKNRFWRGVGRSVTMAVSTQAWGSVVAPLIGRVGNFTGDVRAYNSVRDQALSHTLAWVDSQIHIPCIAGHSLGSVLLFDLMTVLKKEYPELYKRVEQISFLGSPLDVWPFRIPREEHQNILEDKKVYYVYGRFDAASWGKNDFYKFKNADSNIRTPGGHKLYDHYHHRGYIKTAPLKVFKPIDLL